MHKHTEKTHHFNINIQLKMYVAIQKTNDLETITIKNSKNITLERLTIM